MVNTTLPEPSSLQLAFALVLNRSKPQNISVREYLLALRDHTYPGPRPQFSATYEEAQKNYINAAFYFEALLKDAQKQNDALSNKIKVLERRVSAIDDDLSDDNKPNAQNRARDCHIGNNAAAGSHIAVVETLEEALESLGRLRTTEETLSRHILEMQISSQNTPLDRGRICRLIVQICTSIGAELDSMSSQRTDHGESNDIRSEEKHDRSLNALSGIISLVFASFNILTSTNRQNFSFLPSGEDLNLVATPAYAIINLFKRIVDCLFKNNQSETLEPDTQGNTNPKFFSRLCRAYVSSLIQQQAKCKDAPGPQVEAYRNLVEGVLYILLTRAGDQLYTNTFATPRKATIEAEISTTPVDALDEESADTGDISAPEHDGTTRIHGTTIRSRCILDLLRMILPQYHRASRSCENTPGRSRDLVATPLLVLQNTLVREVFGSPRVSGDGNIGTVLGLPAMNAVELEQDEYESEEAEEDGGEGWFAKKMWEIVGWDVLARGFKEGG